MGDDLSLDALWQAASGLGLGKVSSANRIPIGKSNAVFDVVVDKRRLIARRAPGRLARYRAEADVIERVRAAGIPAPEVLGITEVDGTSVMFQERLPGVMVGDVLATCDREDRVVIGRRMGETLAAIHQIPVVGFGNLDAGLTGRRSTFVEWFIGDLPALVDAATRSTTDASLRRRIAVAHEELTDGVRAFSDVHSRLAHGDFATGNVLVSKGTVSGVLDWESAKGGPPALDFGWWNAWAEITDDDVSRAMVRGYSSASTVDLALLAEQGRLVVLRILIGALAWAADRNEPDLVARVTGRLSALRGP